MLTTCDQLDLRDSVTSLFAPGHQHTEIIFCLIVGILSSLSWETIENIQVESLMRINYNQTRYI